MGGVRFNIISTNNNMMMTMQRTVEDSLRKQLLLVGMDCNSSLNEKYWFIKIDRYSVTSQ